MTPEVCVATIDALPVTGGQDALVLTLGVMAVGVVVLGAIALLLARLRRGAALTVGALLVVGMLAAASAPAPAHAAASVAYEGDCTLIAVSDVAGPPASLSGGLVPGDEVQIVSAVVTNPTGEPIELALSASLAAPLAEIVSARTLIDGADDDTVSVAPGARVTVGLVLALPPTVGNGAQGLAAGAALLVTATQR